MHNSEQKKAWVIGLPYFAAALIFSLAVSTTNGYFWADSADYVDSVIAYQNGVDYQFWEFGHLLWRPLGWIIWSSLFDISDANVWRNQIFLTYMWISLISGLGSTLVLAHILRNLNVSVAINITTIAGFVFFHGFINFAQTGTSYVTALFFLIVAYVFSFHSSPSRPHLGACLAGCALALSTVFWIAFVWTIPAGILVAPILYGFSASNIRRAVVTLAAFMCIVLVIFGTVLMVMQIDSVPALNKWIMSASHGNETSGIARMIFGISRSFVFMGDVGLDFKRFLIADSQSKPEFWVLINATLLKVVVFYAVGGLLTFVLLRSSIGRRYFLFGIVACVPLSVFAVSFDGGALERYLPFAPAVFMAFAVGISVSRSQIVKGSLIVAIVALVTLNSISMVLWERVALNNAGRDRALTARILTSNNAVVFLISWNDPLVNFNRSFPFHELNNFGNVRLNVLVTPGLDQTKTWREEFAARVLRAWGQGQEVWLSTRGFVDSPEPEWRWIDGDDRNVRWADFPSFLNELEFGERIGGPDGYVKVARTVSNQSLFNRLADQFDRAF